MLASDLALLREAKAPSPSVRLLAFEDNFLVLHGGPRHVTDARHHGRELTPWGSLDRATIGDAKHIITRCFVAAGALAGFREYDAGAREVATLALDALPAATAEALSSLAAETATFLRDEIGHARSFSLDSEDEIRKRVKALRASRPGGSS